MPCQCQDLFAGAEWEWKDITSVDPRRERMLRLEMLRLAEVATRLRVGPWQDMTSVAVEPVLEDKPGVYVLRIRQREPSYQSGEQVVWDLFQRTGLQVLINYGKKRLKRLDRIDECPVIYIGAAPTGLLSRFEDLAMRHTAAYPLWALLYAGWKVDYGWLRTDTSEPAKQIEKKLKGRYRRDHGRLPALMRR